MTRPNAGYRDGKTIRRWATYKKPETVSEVDDTIVNEELFPRPIGQATETVIVPDPEMRSVDNSRPTLPDEDEDGLDPLTAEVIRQAEKTPAAGERPPFGLDEEQPVEPAEEAIENQGDLPGLADQGEEGPDLEDDERKAR